MPPLAAVSHPRAELYDHQEGRWRHVGIRFLGAARLALGAIFLWAFLDKLFGFSFATPPARSVLQGGSPTKGYLSGAVGPFANQFHAIAGNPVTDVLFMAGLCGVGLALLLGAGVRIAGVAGASMMLFMWLSHPPWAVTPAASHPFLDDHIVYACVLLAFAFLHAGRALGLGRVWQGLAIVQRHPWLE
ncbi:MAG: hypothetical protein V4510_05280 [bacterium]